MTNKKTITEIIVVALILFAITAVAAAVLAGVNSVTAPIIAENDKKAQEVAMKEVLPDATIFGKMEYTPTDGSSVTEIYLTDAGYAVKAEPVGYGGAISIVVGVDNDLVVTGIKIISQNETAGLGSKCTDDAFKDQFVGKTENIVVTKNGAKGNEIDAISSATRTSKAVTKGVNDSISAVKSVKEVE